MKDDSDSHLTSLVSYIAKLSCLQKTNVKLFFSKINADSSFVPPLVYAMLGSSKDLAVGTVAVASLLISSMLGKVVSPTENPKLYVQLALTSTFFAGVFQASLGLLRYTLRFDKKRPSKKHPLFNF